MRIVNTILSTVVMSLVVLIMTSDNAQACSVRPLDEVIKDADLIFEGHLIRYTTYPNHPFVKVFKVDKAWSHSAHFVGEVPVAETGIVYQENSLLPDAPVDAEKVIWALSKKDIKEVEGTELYFVPHCDSGMYSSSGDNLKILDRKFPGVNAK